MDKKTIGLIIGGLVIVTVLICLTVLLLLGDESLVAWIVAGIGGVATIIGKPLVYYLTRDADGDGTPDVLQGDDS